MIPGICMLVNPKFQEIAGSSSSLKTYRFLIEFTTARVKGEQEDGVEAIAE